MAFGHKPNSFLEPSSTYPLPTPPSTSHSNSTKDSALKGSRIDPHLGSVEDDAYNEGNEVFSTTPTRSPAGSDSPFFLSPEPDTQSKPSFDIPSSPSSSLPSSLNSRLSSRLNSPTPRSRNTSQIKNKISVSTRLQFLARLAETEEPILPDESLEAIHAQIDTVQRGLVEPAELSPIEPTPTSPSAPAPPEPTHPKPPPPELSTLRSISASHSDLLSTVTHLTSSLRARHEESLHIHALYTEKLEAVAQRCITLENDLSETTKRYKQDLHDKDTEIEDLVLETNRLEMETERSNQDALEREVAIRAMGAAVGGLEGWVTGWGRRQETRAKTPLATPRNSAPAVGGAANGTPRSTPASGSGSGRKKTKEVIRGKGRFRGKVLVEEDEEDDGDRPLYDGSTPTPRSAHGGKPSDHYHSPRDRDDSNPIHQSTHDVSDILDGLRAWINGFRDVEEGFRESLDNHAHSNPAATVRPTTRPLAVVAAAAGESEGLNGHAYGDGDEGRGFG
ncbi:MAG: hypothetical protein Q9160_001946 [Pyrenula sp. 1 TL-2023]